MAACGDAGKPFVANGAEGGEAGVEMGKLAEAVVQAPGGGWGLGWLGMVPGFAGGNFSSQGPFKFFFSSRLLKHIKDKVPVKH